jgi:hypothetical protein
MDRDHTLGVVVSSPGSLFRPVRKLYLLRWGCSVNIAKSVFITAGQLMCGLAFVFGQTKPPLKPAAKGPAASAVPVLIDQTYSQGFADEAYLDAKKPQLSSDGFKSQAADGTATPALASAECLISQTILAAPASNPGLSSNAVANICTNNGKQIVTRYEPYFPASGAQPPVINYALIHVVRWDVPAHGNGAPSPSGTWYLFERKSLHPGSVIPWKNVTGVSAITATTHLLGDKNVAFLAIHLGIDDSCGISYDIKATHTTPLNRQDVTSLIQTAESVFGSNAKGSAKPKPVTEAEAELSDLKLGMWGGTVILQGQATLPESVTLTPSMIGSIRALAAKEPRDKLAAPSVVGTCKPAGGQAEGAAPPKESSPNARLATSRADFKPNIRSVTQTIARPKLLLVQFREPMVSTNKVGLFNMLPEAQGQAAQTQSQPATSSDGSSAKKDPLAALSLTIANEGRHYWDVSIAMPVTTYKSIKYDSTNNLLVPKSTTSLNPYALFDFYPDPVDLAAYSGSGIAISTPKITAGIPIGNQPLQKPFVGTGFIGTIKSFRFQPVVGLRVQKEMRPNSPTSTATHFEWHANLQVMIGFSISDARKVLGIK